ncbi:MAG: hypothetical protein QM398_00035 [Thermoproteota archaeon]|jgi:hypothetical protein|nr:hypothetical protein [Thermoproteota archaeon]
MKGSNQESKGHEGKIDAQSIVIKALAEKKALNMWEIKEQKQLFYSTVHKAINSLQKEGLVEPIKSQISQKGGTTTLFGLTFQGFVRFLASQPELWHPKEIGTVRDVEALKKKQAKKKEEFSKLLEITQSCGELLNYAIFKEIYWLTERYGPYFVHDVVDVARLIEASGAMELIERYRTKLIQAKKKKQNQLRELEFERKAKISIQDKKNVEATYNESIAEIGLEMQDAEKCLEILLQKQADWWKRMFAVRLAERILASPAKGDMHNEALYLLFKQVADKIRELEVEPIEDMAEIFRTGDVKEVQKRLLGSLNEKSTDGSGDSNA